MYIIGNIIAYYVHEISIKLSLIREANAKISVEEWIKTYEKELKCNIIGLYLDFK